MIALASNSACEFTMTFSSTYVRSDLGIFAAVQVPDVLNMVENLKKTQARKTDGAAGALGDLDQC